MSDQIRTRRGILEDARTIASIHVRAWQTAYRGLFADDFLDSLSVDDREQFWVERLSRSGTSVLVATKGAAVHGWTAYGASRDTDAGSAAAEVYGIYVDPAHWGHGFGTAMWAEVVRLLRAERWETVALWVLEANSRARSFYEARGASPDGTRKEVERETVRQLELRYSMRLS